MVWRHLIRGFVSLVGAVGVCKSVRIVGVRSDGIPDRDVLGEWRAVWVASSNGLSTRLCAYVWAVDRCQAVRSSPMWLSGGDDVPAPCKDGEDSISHKVG